MSNNNQNLMGGIVLLIIGGYFLLRNLGWVPMYIDWDLIWPIGLIGLGGWLILKHR